MDTLILGQKTYYSWSLTHKAYPRIVNRAMEVLIQFATTYLSESGCSTLVTIKTNSRNRLDVQHDMRVALSKTTPQFNILIKKKHIYYYITNLFFLTY
jgi:hypothetical protein